MPTRACLCRRAPELLLWLGGAAAGAAAAAAVAGGVMLRVLGMSAQDTLGSLTGRAAAAEWARHQVCAGKPIRDRHHRPAKCADGPSARHSLDGALTEQS